MTPEEIAEALSIECEICHVQPGAECMTTTCKNPRPLIEVGDRRFHHYRKVIK